MGEELGLEDAVVPAERQVDPGDRDGCRAPIPWERGASHGWSAEPWLPFAPEAAARSVEAQRADAGSLLHLYRRLIAARSASAALSSGTLELIDAPEGVLVYGRSAPEDSRLVAINYTSAPVVVELPGELEVELASDGRGAAEPFAGRLEADQALILRPHS